MSIHYLSSFFIAKRSVYHTTDRHKRFEDTKCTSDNIFNLKDTKNRVKLKNLI